MRDATRDDAADERGEEQHVDGCEPRRAVDVEEPGLVQELTPPAVGLHELCGLDRLAGSLRQDRARDGAHREHEQQDQRDAHRGDLPPAPSQPALEAEARRGRRPRSCRSSCEPSDGDPRSLSIHDCR